MVKIWSKKKMNLSDMDKIKKEFRCPVCKLITKHTTMPILNSNDLYIKTDGNKDRFERINLMKKFIGKGICWDCYNKYTNYNKGNSNNIEKLRGLI